MRIDITISVGYVRQRGAVGDRIEARIGTVGLLIVGGIVTLVLLVLIVPRVLALL